jgi:hypothetical protein
MFEKLGLSLYRRASFSLDFRDVLPFKILENSRQVCSKYASGLEYWYESRMRRLCYEVAKAPLALDDVPDLYLL